MVKQALRDGLIGCWRFNETLGLTAHDTSGYGNHGTLTDSPVWSAGKYGGGLTFSGTHSRVTFASFPEVLKNLTALTVAFWITPSAYTGAYRHIFDTGWAGNGTFVVFLDISTNALYFCARNSAGTYGYAAYNYTPAVQIHVACTWDGSYLRIYVNSALVAGPVAFSGTMTYGAAFTIGKADATLVDMLDEYYVFNRALSAAETKLLRLNSPEARDPAWLIQYHNGTQFIPISASLATGKKIEGVSDELNGHEEASFSLPNTSDNRSFVQSDKTARFNFIDDNFVYRPVYTGTLKGYLSSLTKIKCLVYKTLYELLQRRTFTGSYTDTAANTILGAITGAGSDTDTFGFTDLGGATGDTPYGYVEAVKALMKNVAGASVTKIRFYCWGVYGSAYVKCALYSTGEDGKPNALLGVTDEVEVTTTHAWYEFTFASPVSVDANTYYYIAWMTTDLIHMKDLDAVPPSGEHWYDEVDYYGDGFKDSFTYPSWEPYGEDYGHQPNIYCVFTYAASSNCPTTLSKYRL